MTDPRTFVISVTLPVMVPKATVKFNVKLSMILVEETVTEVTWLVAYVTVLATVDKAEVTMGRVPLNLATPLMAIFKAFIVLANSASTPVTAVRVANSAKGCAQRTDS